MLKILIFAFLEDSIPCGQNSYFSSTHRIKACQAEDHKPCIENVKQMQSLAMCSLIISCYQFRDQ